MNSSVKKIPGFPRYVLTRKGALLSIERDYQYWFCDICKGDGYLLCGQCWLDPSIVIGICDHCKDCSSCGGTGEIKSTKKEQYYDQVEVFVGRDGYRQAYLYRGTKKTRHPKKIYQLMAKTFLEERPSKDHLVRHLDGNSINDSIENLAWGTHADNMEDLKKHNEDRATLNDELKLAITIDIRRSKLPLYDPEIRVNTLLSISLDRMVPFTTVNRIYWEIIDTIGK